MPNGHLTTAEALKLLDARIVESVLRWGENPHHTYVCFELQEARAISDGLHRAIVPPTPTLTRTEP